MDRIPEELKGLIGPAMAARYGACHAEAHYLRDDETGRPFGVAGRLLSSLGGPNCEIRNGREVRLYPWCVVLIDAGDCEPFWMMAEAGAVEQVVSAAYEAAGSIEGVTK